MSTSSVARLVATVASSKDCSNSVASIVDLLEQLAQRRDVGLVELAVLAEVRNQRRHPAVEQPRQQAFAFAQQPGFALQHRGIEVTTPFPLRGDRALLQQSEIGRAHV